MTSNGQVVQHVEKLRDGSRLVHNHVCCLHAGKYISYSVGRTRDCTQSGSLHSLLAEAERAIEAFDAKVAAAKAVAAERAQGKTIAFFRTRGRQWRLYGRHGACGGEAIYDALEMRAPEMVADRGTGLNPEKLVRFDADYLIIVADGTPGAGQTMNRLRTHPLWRRVTAVREGRVLELTTYRHWILSGLVGKARMIDEVLQCLRLGEPSDGDDSLGTAVADLRLLDAERVSVDDRRLAGDRVGRHP